MFINQAAETAKQFLLEYTKDQYYFTPKAEYAAKGPESLRFYFSKVEYSMEIEAGPTIVLFFIGGAYFCESYEHDQELNSIMQQCMNALKEAHPVVFENRIKVVVTNFHGNIIIAMENYS